MSSYSDPHGRKSSSKNTDRHHSSSDGRHRSSRSSSLSFIFVINRLGFYDNDPLPGDPNDICRDEYVNTLPPRTCRGYTGETPSQVMRYYDGIVTRVPDYAWYRPTWGENGAICRVSDWTAAEEASSYGVFACNPHLPIVVIPGDPTANLLSNHQSIMHALQFAHLHGSEGISFATAGYTEHVSERCRMITKYLDGRSSLVPSLVPPPYAPQRAIPYRSKGLAGELPILLGMMAFSQRRLDDVFIGRNAVWRNRVWHDNTPSRPELYPPDAFEHPVGFYVTVCLDPENPESTHDKLLNFQWGSSAIVKEPPSSSSSRR